MIIIKDKNGRKFNIYNPSKRIYGLVRESLDNPNLILDFLKEGNKVFVKVSGLDIHGIAPMNYTIPLSSLLNRIDGGK